MTEHQSSRTLVKSAPELWAECSDAASLARHLGAFGEIRITKLEPETAVAWEGAAASGTVKLESSGWGTRVTLTVREEAAPAPPERVPAEPEPELEAAAASAPEPTASEPEAAVASAPEPTAGEPDPEAVAHEPVAAEAEPAQAALTPQAAPRRGMFARFRLFRRRPAAVAEPDAAEPEPEPVAVAVAVAQPEPHAETAPDAEAPRGPVPEGPPRAVSPQLSGEEALVAALDSLGMAHHRPYSRA
jgi:hypothetical protein